MFPELIKTPWLNVPTYGVLVAAAFLVALWLAYSLWLLARFATLVLRARSTAWLVTGAVRR